MSTQTVAQSPNNHRRTIIRRRWPIILAGLLVLAALTYGLISRSTLPSSPAKSSHPSRVDPATQSVLDYLRAHNIVQPLPTAAQALDPGQQSVMDYLRAHGVEQDEDAAP